MDINFNQAECLKNINNFGYTIVKNVCNGHETIVPWGSVDILGNVFAIIFTTIIFAELVCIIYSMSKDF